MISRGVSRDKYLAEEWAARLKRWGLDGLAPFVADILRPFGFLGAQALYLLSPVLTAFSSEADIKRLAALLESPEALDHVTERLTPPEHD